MIFYFEFKGNLAIVAILFYLRNRSIEGNLTIVAILFYLRNPTVASMKFSVNVKKI